MSKESNAVLREVVNTQLLVESGTKVLAAKFPDLTFERVLCHPRKAIRFCQLVREDLAGGPHHADHTILWTMLNGRKRGDFNHGLKPKQEAAHV